MASAIACASLEPAPASPDHSDVTPAEAAHTVWLLTSFDAYDLLAAGRGLGPGEVAWILCETAERALLAPA